MNKYRKGIPMRVCDEYDSIDFDCRCIGAECIETLIDPMLIEGLSALLSEFPMLLITSGFRCEAHNKAIGGKTDSQHLLGKAVDLRCRFATPEEMMHKAEKLPMFFNGGIGLYLNFLHVDVRGTRARWSYNNLRENNGSKKC